MDLERRILRILDWVRVPSQERGARNRLLLPIGDTLGRFCPRRFQESLEKGPPFDGWVGCAVCGGLGDVVGVRGGDRVMTQTGPATAGGDRGRQRPIHGQGTRHDVPSGVGVAQREVHGLSFPAAQQSHQARCPPTLLDPARCPISILSEFSHSLLPEVECFRIFFNFYHDLILGFEKFAA